VILSATCAAQQLVPGIDSFEARKAAGAKTLLVRNIQAKLFEHLPQARLL
jgi:hypothetical protein